MKMVKSLLLGSAAGLVAVAGAQAADLPVKAKPVEYVKVCSLYGAGFYYMPGTDICIKIGGYVRAQYYSNGATSGTLNGFVSNGGFTDRGNNSTTASSMGVAVSAHNQDFLIRSRLLISVDTRQQTEYGTLRTYLNLGYSVDSWSNQTTAPGLYTNRGFIQLAGFTFGKAQSFYDIFSNPSVSYLGLPGSDTGDGGILLAAYTAQFGNGFTGTISIEEPRRTAVANDFVAVNGVTFAGLGPAFPGGYLAAATATAPNLGDHYGSVQSPDIVGTLRVDQAWGSAQLGVALHQVRANYYDITNVATGYPSDKWGFAVGLGTIINADFITPGDKFQIMGQYAEGAMKYLNQTWGGSSWGRFDGATVGYGLITDAVYGGTNAGNGSGLQLTKGWNLNVSYDHLWNQRWKTSLYGTYNKYEYGSQATDQLCGVTAGVRTPGCSADWSFWTVGSRTQFNINSATYMGLDVMYVKMNTSTLGNTSVGGTAFWNNPSTANGRIGNFAFADQDQVIGTFRVHRDFLP